MVSKDHDLSVRRQCGLVQPQWHCPAGYCIAITERVLSWRLSNSIPPMACMQATAGRREAGFCPLGRLLRNRLPAMVEALKEAIAKYGKPEIMNSPSRALLRNTLPGNGPRQPVHRF